MVKVGDKKLWDKMKDQLNKAKSADDLESWQGGSGDFKTLESWDTFSVKLKKVLMGLVIHLES